MLTFGIMLVVQVLLLDILKGEKNKLSIFQLLFWNRWEVMKNEQDLLRPETLVQVLHHFLKFK